MTQSQQVIRELQDCYTKTLGNIFTYYEGDEKEKKMKELRDLLESNCMQNKKLKLADDVKTRVLLGGFNGNDESQIDIVSLIEEYKKGISEIDTDVSGDNNLIEFNNQLQALLANESQTDADAELQLSGANINIIDPISKKRIVDPVKNSICGHTYDRASITELVKVNPHTRCPFLGCPVTEFVSLANLRTDMLAKMYLEKNPENSQLR